MDAVEIYINQAIEHKKNDRLPEAVAAYSEAFDYLLMEARNFAKKTVGYIDEGESRKIPQEYFDAVQKYLQRDKNAAQVSNNTGVLFARLGDLESAKKWYEQAIQLTPVGEDFEEARINLRGLD